MRYDQLPRIIIKTDDALKNSLSKCKDNKKRRQSLRKVQEQKTLNNCEISEAMLNVYTKFIKEKLGLAKKLSRNEINI